MTVGRDRAGECSERERVRERMERVRLGEIRKRET